MYKDTNFILCLKQPKSLYRELTSSRFISSFENIRKLGTYKCSDKRCKVCLIYLNKIMSNGQVREICRESDSQTVNVTYYLGCEMCNKKKHILRKQRNLKLE